MSRARDVLERLAVAAVSWPSLSRVTGRLAELRVPRPLLVPLIHGYARLYGADLAEAARPPEAYESFSAFFTRRLRDGARPIDATPGVVVSPSDSRLSAIGRVAASGRIEQVKGQGYALEALLGSAQDAQRLAGAAHATLYLSPAMYHRVHAPVDGRIVAWHYLPGRLYPVNAMGVRAVPGLLARNERVSVLIETGTHGLVAVVLVGAANVGRIGLAFAGLATNSSQAAGRREPPEPIPIRRGDELGVFNLGSTVVLLVADPGLAEAARAGELVRVGQALWRHGAPAPASARPA